MYDFRSPRPTRKVSRPSSRRHVTHKPKTIRVPTRRTNSAAKSSSSSLGQLIVRSLAYAGAAVAILGISLYFLAKTLLPMVFPLERDQIVAFVPAENASSSEIVVVAFKPSAGSLVGATLPNEVMAQPTPGGDSRFSSAAWSQALRLIVDQTLVVTAPIQVRDGEEISHLLWQDMETTGIWERLKLTQLRLWVFIQTLPTSQQRWLAINSPMQWQRSKFQFALGNEFLQCPVGVINTTSTSGLATSMSQLIEESGYPVVQLNDNRDNLSNSVIYFDPDTPECQLEAERLSQLMTGQPQIEANAGLVKRHRAQIVIYLGQDMVPTPSPSPTASE